MARRGCGARRRASISSSYAGPPRAAGRTRTGWLGPRPRPRSSRWLGCLRPKSPRARVVRASRIEMSIGRVFPPLPDLALLTLIPCPAPGVGHFVGGSKPRPIWRRFDSLRTETRRTASPARIRGPGGVVLNTCVPCDLKSPRASSGPKTCVLAVMIAELALVVELCGRPYGRHGFVRADDRFVRFGRTRSPLHRCLPVVRPSVLVGSAKLQAVWKRLLLHDRTRADRRRGIRSPVSPALPAAPNHSRVRGAVELDGRPRRPGPRPPADRPDRVEVTTAWRLDTLASMKVAFRLSS